MGIFETIAIAAVCIGIFVTVLFIISIIIGRNDIADSAWGTGIVFVAGIGYWLSHEKGVLLTTLFVLVVLWGIRLSVRILLRNIKKSEDYRYKRWRDEWGRLFYLRSYAQVYLLQGALMIVVGYPLLHVSVYGNSETFGILALVGLLVWIVGYFFEVVGDWQLDRFINSKPERDTVLSTGLWHYTRHPNYFGEVTMWWGIWLMIASTSFSYVALISPLMITFLILKVSGIPLLEQRFAHNPNFIEYKKRTSAFFPLPTKRH